MDKSKTDPQAAVTVEKASSPRPGKKPYEAPRILYRAPLEAMASVCSPDSGQAVGKAFPGAGNCEEAFS